MPGVEFSGFIVAEINLCQSNRWGKEVMKMNPTDLFLQAYSRNGTSPQEATSVFEGVVVRDSFSSRICDCPDCDTIDCG